MPIVAIALWKLQLLTTAVHGVLGPPPLPHTCSHAAVRPAVDDSNVEYIVKIPHGGGHNDAGQDTRVD